MVNEPVPSGTEAEVCKDLAQRQALGLSKYGVRVIDNPLQLKEWLQHAYEECLDQAVYLKRAIQKIDELSFETKIQEEVDVAGIAEVVMKQFKNIMP